VVCGMLSMLRSWSGDADPEVTRYLSGVGRLRERRCAWGRGYATEVRRA
jgi:hypothetical protein